MHPYDQKPLVCERDFRLLRISQGRIGEPIDCSLLVLAIDNAPSYLALSYTWGKPEKTQVVNCDGRDLNITANLYAALQRYREPDEDMMLWADAICIDQSNVQERNHQVRLMKSIYERAPATVVYLGEAGPNCARVLQMWKSLRQAEEKLGPRQTIDDSELKRYDLPPAGSDLWAALAELFAQPWFFRVWIIQEFAVAQRIFIMYGDQKFPREVLLEICQFMVHHALLGKLVPYGQFTDRQRLNFMSKTFTRVQGLEGIRNRITQKDPPSLENLLCQASRGTNGANDPHDQIFALLGISSAGNGSSIRINYDQSVAETYLQACQQMLANGSQGVFLHAVGYPRSVKDLPSWVPDWSTRKASSDFRNFVDFKTASTYQAGGSSQATWRLTEDARTLIGQGKLVDHISEMGSGFVPPASEEEHLRLLKQHFLTSKGLTERSKTVAEGEDVANTHFRVLTMNKTVSDVLSWGVNTDFYEAFHRGINNFPALPGKPEEEEDFQRGTLMGMIEALGLGRQFCLSSNGYLGQVPGDSQVDDEICIFTGMKTPFVVRKDPKNQGRYLLIGDCYIDGLMYEDALGCDEFHIQDIALV